MGFSISWIAFSNVSQGDALASLGLRDTAEPEFEPSLPESAFATTELPAGWTLVYSQDFDFAFSPAALKAAEQYVTLAVRISEGIMYSEAAFRINGEQVWAVSHWSERGPTDLAIEGQPPPALDAIQARVFAAQAAETKPVDHVFDIPVELAASICGFVHNRWAPELSFTKAEPI